MVKILKHKRKLMLMSTLAAFMILSSTAMAASLSVDCSVSTSGLKKSATAEGYSCNTIGCIIWGTNGDSLASGENGPYSTNSYRTKSVSYTGLKSADYGYGYALDTDNNIVTAETYY